MARKAFYSFHYQRDCWRVAQVRNMGVIEGNNTVSDNKWEEVTKSGEKAIKDWIDNNLIGRSCTIVLIGKETSNRKWVNYEIEKSWNDGKGVLGINIHNLKDRLGNQDVKGSNPFTDFKFKETNLSDIVKTYNPPYSTSTYVYSYIEENIDNWVEEAIKIRNKY